MTKSQNLAASLILAAAFAGTAQAGNGDQYYHEHSPNSGRNSTRVNSPDIIDNRTVITTDSSHTDNSRDVVNSHNRTTTIGTTGPLNVTGGNPTANGGSVSDVKAVGGDASIGDVTGGQGGAGGRGGAGGNGYGGNASGGQGGAGGKAESNAQSNVGDTKTGDVTISGDTIKLPMDIPTARAPDMKVEVSGECPKGESLSFSFLVLAYGKAQSGVDMECLNKRLETMERMQDKTLLFDSITHMMHSGNKVLEATGVSILRRLSSHADEGTRIAAQNIMNCGRGLLDSDAFAVLAGEPTLNCAQIPGRPVVEKVPVPEAAKTPAPRKKVSSAAPVSTPKGTTLVIPPNNSFSVVVSAPGGCDKACPPVAPSPK